MQKWSSREEKGFRSFFVFLLYSFHREELEKQRSETAYRKKHEAGQTDEARRDLARLALIRQQREEAARKKELERGIDILFLLRLHLSLL